MKLATTLLPAIPRVIATKTVCLPFLLATMLVSGLFAQNQPLKFEHLGLEHGLSQSTVYCILQDRQGFMWFGTQAGLNKYDGFNFTSYQQDVFDSTTISGNVVWTIYEDHTGTLWAGDWNSACINRFERDTERFTRFKHDPKNPNSLSAGSILDIYEDHTGTLWVGTDNGLNRFDREKEQFSRYLYDPEDPNGLQGYSVFSIYEDRAGMLWIGTERWLNKFDREKQQFISYEYDARAMPITAIFEDRAGTLWAGSEGAGLKKFDRATGRFTAFFHDPKNAHSLSSDSVRTIFEDRFGALWIGTWNGLNLFDREQQRFIRFKHDSKNPFSLSDNVIWSIYEDHSGILWIGTYNGGINKLDRGKEQFIAVTSDPGNPYSLSDNRAMGFYKDHTGTLWVGTGNGLNRFDAEAKQFTTLVHDPQKSNSLGNNSVRVIYEDHLGMLWLGTRKGLDMFDPTTKYFTHYLHDPNNPNSLSNNLITVIYEDRHHVLWFGTFGGGLNRFDREKNQFTRFVPDSKNPNSIRGSVVWAISEDSLSRNILWVAANGLNRFDRNTEQFIHLVNDPKNPNSLSHDYVGPLWVDRRGTLWVGTMGGGLNRFDHKTEQFTYFTTKDGLPDNQVCGILEDAHGRLWLTTNVGISRFDPKTKTFRNYDVADGLASNSFFMPSQHKSADGEMFFGSEYGFTRFYPDSINDNPYIPPVVITAFKRYNTGDAEGIALEEKGISAKQEVTVSYKDKVLNFEFAALSYRNTFKNQYAYMLEGFNDNWIQLGTKHDVTFTNLDPGEYTLRVKGSNNDGVWNEEGTSLKIIITPPWWRTRWAYAGYFILFAAALYGWRRFEINRVKLRNELRMKNFEAQKLQEMDHMKSRFFANISHEFRTPLTLILGPVEQMRSKAFSGNFDDAYDMILRNGRRLLRLINQLLDLARLEAGRMSLQARPENIVAFLKGLVLSFASAAERKRINLSVSASEEDIVVYFDRDKLEKIVSNLLSNALKFTLPEGRVEVKISTVGATGPVAPTLFASMTTASTKEYVEISATDNGPGIPLDQLGKIFDRFYQVDASHTREHEGTGIGLALTKELVELHHGEISVQSEVGRGTTFIVRLPLGKEHLKEQEVVSDQFSVASNQFARIEDRELQIEDRETSLQQQGTSNEQPETSDEPLLLIVEDNADVRTYIRQYLEPAHKIIEAVDGIAGVQIALEIIPDLIITDVMMPKRDGNELCRMLKTDEKTSHVPIIMLTAKADSESKVHGLETGADDYLIKPFEANELLTRVHNLIKLRRKLRERFSREIVLKPQDIAITPKDEVFLNKVKAVVEEYLSDENFEVETLSRKVGMSHSQIHRKLKALTNQSASQFIRSMRLARAVELLKQDAGTVAEIAYQVGFGSQAYFTKCFHEQFGCSPSEYRKAKRV